MTTSTSARKPRSGAKRGATSAEAVPVQLIALDDIDPSPLNRCSRNIDELVPSVRELGVQQPIKVRPQGARFEIVYGERRFRAARKVGLKAIPAIVENLTDEEAQAARVIENICCLLRARSNRHYPDCWIIPTPLADATRQPPVQVGRVARSLADAG